MMKALAEFPAMQRRQIRNVLCDIDDTLTSDGRLTAAEISKALDNRIPETEVAKHIPRFDTDGDKKLNVDEAAEAIKSMARK